MLQERKIFPCLFQIPVAAYILLSSKCIIPVSACVGGNSDMLPLVDCEFSGQNRGEVGHYWGEVGAYGLWKTCGPGGSRGISLTSGDGIRDIREWKRC